MSFLIDTNVISEVRKGPRCDSSVAAWYAGVDDTQLYLSVIMLGEIGRGAERLRPRDAARAGEIDQWLDAVNVAFAGRILPIDAAVAGEWGRMSAARSIPVIDCLLAATAKIHTLTLVTRNVRDVAGLGARLLNPFGDEQAPA